MKFNWKDDIQRIYVFVTEQVYDGDNEGGVKVKVFTEKERAKSLYLDQAYANERYFLNTYQEHALINRDDQTMYCECYAETEQYCKTHAVVYVKSFEL
jgi:hypothetical protein